ncbi:hypothetical protein JK628_01595 [Shewanella sp. KX20019]|uniref:hypothetical protein n=1 Tax=Shewanella sp. KX20019 TaxID=2803864 RepID=UPI001928AB1C|nr:hypothetical protein [Shewanella sp. KX20019]QQX80604.1 hypothetical protein JK628_01595 [Shewanella sp. KX20019]
MCKRIAYLALLISLVGQFLLSPAMAMPKFLHASSKVSLHAQQIEQASLPLERLLISSMGGSNQETSNCGSSMPSINTSMVDCDALCEILGAGDCVSHCISTPAIMEQVQLNLTAQQAGQSLQTAFWSPQTAEQASINPPPI